MSHWYLQPVLNSYAAVAAVAGVLCLLLLIGPFMGRLTRLQRGILIVLRLAVIALLAVAMLRPTHVSTSRRPQTAVLVALFDRSRSMQLPHSATHDPGGRSSRTRSAPPSLC